MVCLNWYKPSLSFSVLLVVRSDAVDEGSRACLCLSLLAFETTLDQGQQCGEATLGPGLLWEALRAALFILGARGLSEQEES